MDNKELVKRLTTIQTNTCEYRSCYYKNECNNYPNCTPIKNVRKLWNRITGKQDYEPCIYKMLEDLIEELENEQR